MDTNMQFTINDFRQLFPDISLIFSTIPNISLTAVPDISRFSRKVVTMAVVSDISGGLKCTREPCDPWMLPIGKCLYLKRLTTS